MAEESVVENGFDEKVLRIEAQEIVKEVAFAVEKVEISKTLPSSEDLVHLNIQTKENTSYCVELSVRGFQVSNFPVGNHGLTFSGAIVHLQLIDVCPIALGKREPMLETLNH